MNLPFFDISRREARDAARLAIQSAVAAAMMYSVMEAAQLPEKFVGVLSAVLVVQPSVGNTLVKGWERFAATVVGCLIGAICLFVLPDGYGTAAALAFSMLAMNALAGFRPSWRYGVVAAVALALGADGTVFQTTIDRSLSIGIGVIIGILVSLIVWPDSASSRAERFLRSALRASADCLNDRLRQKTDDRDRGDDAHQRYLSDIHTARDAAASIRIADRDSVEERLKAVERFHQSVTILGRVVDGADSLTEGRRELFEPIEVIRTNACRIATAISQGDADHEQAQQRIQKALVRLRDVVVRERDDPVKHEYRNALVFGLDEIETSTGRLIELYSQ